MVTETVDSLSHIDIADLLHIEEETTIQKQFYLHIERIQQ
jgi:hypothetical protein